ncbi:uncharacterized protein LOC118467259 [Anopheles albimanus]|uniref:uncharacterized protein LOC118467259 n=1 Tax=Anopheles albimanus TaxID=7167 RepID=UPI00163E7872|nr:uncharacterized protein LOC118467259 [Anopheles albimanus]
MTFEENLIAKVRANEVLYNVKNVNYRRKNDKERLWQQIAYDLHCPVEVCRRRWKSLRDKFIKLSRAEHTSRGTSDEEQPRKWRYYDSLTFLLGCNKASLSNTSTFLDGMFMTDERYVDIKCEHPNNRQYVRDDTAVVATECTSVLSSTDRFTVDGRAATVTLDLPSSTGGSSSGNRKRSLDNIESECVKIIRSAAETIQLEASCNIRKSSTQLLFEALALRIDEANMPAARLNALHTAVTNLVYSSL